MTMKNLFILSILIILVATSSLHSNPIEPPPIITEVYFDENENWTLEFYIDEYFYSGMVNLDSLRINTAIIKDQVIIQMGVPLIITPDMLLGYLDITRCNGSLHVETYDGYYWLYLDWGIYWDNYDPAPLPGQSWAVQSFAGPEYIHYWLCHSFPPTLGTNIYEASGTGTVQGYIYDLNHNPIPDVLFFINVFITPFYSNDSGYFCFSSVSHRYSFYYNYYDPAFSGDTTLWIEIDSTDNIEIIAPVYLVGIEDNSEEKISIKNYPNPAKNIVNFQVTIPININSETANIIICNLSGKIIDQLPLRKDDHRPSEYYLKWIPPDNFNGLLLYYLVMDNQRSVSGKFIISK